MERRHCQSCGIDYKVCFNGISISRKKNFFFREVGKKEFYLFHTFLAPILAIFISVSKKKENTETTLSTFQCSYIYILLSKFLTCSEELFGIPLSGQAGKFEWRIIAL